MNRSKETIMKLILTMSSVLLFGVTFVARSEAGSITQLFGFPCPKTQFGICPDGYSPNVLIQASDGDFYGAAQFTTFGTSNSHGGTLFKLTPSGSFQLLFTFAPDGAGNYVDGDNPAVALVEGNDGLLYGTCFGGGAHNSGVLFRISKRGTDFAVVHDFCSTGLCTDGSAPGSLVLGHDGNLYGTTAFGGSSAGSCQPVGGCGTIYQFTPAGTFTTLHALNGTSEGASPGGLIQASDGKFYGTTGQQVFRFVSGQQLTVLVSLPKDNGFILPSADSPLLQASNGKLYGALSTYHINQVQFYEVPPSGSGFHEFPPIGTLQTIFSVGGLIQASDGNLWTAFNERSAPDGIVVAMSPDSGAVLQQFPFTGPDGSLPEAGVLQGADGKIYGTTIGGGTLPNGEAPSGTVWSLDAGLPVPKPAVASFSPGRGAVGSTVLIRGDHLIGTTSVSFNGVNAPLQVLNVHFIAATVPVGATSGPITVTNAGGTTGSNLNFTVQ